MSDPLALATLDLLIALMPSAFFTEANLRALVVLKAVNPSLEWGHSDASCVFYVMFGAIAGARFGDYQAGLRFSDLGTELVERRGLTRVQARTYLNYGNLVMPWTKHFRDGRDVLRRAFDAANDTGDVTFAAFSCASLNVNFLAAGDPLADAHREAENGLQFVEKARFGFLVDIITPQLALIRMLRGLTPRFGTFDDTQFDEVRFERHLSSTPALALPESWYWIRKLQARYFAADYAFAVDAASKARRLRWAPPQLFETAEYEFYGALSHAACWNSAPAERRAQHVEALSAHHAQLQTWAGNCPEELREPCRARRSRGGVHRRPRLRRHAPRRAGHPLGPRHGLSDNEAVAKRRLRGRRGAWFRADRAAHLRNADRAIRMGADGKVRQLDERYPRPDQGRAFARRTRHDRCAHRAPGARRCRSLEAPSGRAVSRGSSRPCCARRSSTPERRGLLSGGAERAVDPRRGDHQRHVGDGVCPPRGASLGGASESVVRYAVRTEENASWPMRRPDPGDDSSVAGVPGRPLPAVGQAGHAGGGARPRAQPRAERVHVRPELPSCSGSSRWRCGSNSRLDRELEEREARIRRLVDAHHRGRHR